MKRAEMIAIMSAEVAPFEIDDLQVVRQEDLAAILAPPPRRRLGKRADVVHASAERMARLEGLMPSGAVLPVLPGHILAPHEARATLAANAELLRRELRRSGLLRQFQVTLHVAEPDGTRENAFRDEVVRRLLADLEAVSDEIHLLPTTAGLAANAVVLVSGDEADRLEHVLSGIDALGPDRLRLRLVGPAPPVSFASIAIRRVPPREIAGARRLLGVSRAADRDEVRRARAARLRAGTGERPETVRAAAEILRAAATSGQPGVPVFLARVWSEGMAATPRHATCEVA